MARNFIDAQDEGPRGPEQVLPPDEIAKSLEDRKGDVQAAVNALLPGILGTSDLDEALESLEEMDAEERLLKTGKVATTPASDLEIIPPTNFEKHEKAWRNELAQSLDTTPNDIIFRPLEKIPNYETIRVLPEAQRNFENVQGGELFESLQSHDFKAQTKLRGLVEVRSKSDRFEEFYMQQLGKELVPVSKPFTFVKEDSKILYHDCPRLDLDAEEPVDSRTFIGTDMPWVRFQKTVREHFPKDQYPQIEIFSLGDPGNSGPILRIQQADGEMFLKSAAQVLANESAKRIRMKAQKPKTPRKPSLLQRIQGMFG